METIETPDGPAQAYLAGEGPGVLLYMDAFGPRPALERIADRIAAAGYRVLAPNVFHRDTRAPFVTDELMASEEARGELFPKLREWMGSLTPDAVAADARAYLDFLGDGPVGVTGYCMGGRLALLTAGAAPDRVAAVGTFHAGNLATDAPESPHRVLHRVRAEVYCAHADADRSMPPEQIERLEAALGAAGLTYRTEVYPGAAHGFTMSDLPVYDAAADERHERELLDLFGRALR